MRRRIEPLPDLLHDYSGAIVRRAAVGPRREVTLRLELWAIRDGRSLPSWRGGEGDRAEVRFGGIDDFERVAAFWRSFAGSRSARESLHFLRLEAGSRAGEMLRGVAPPARPDR